MPESNLPTTAVTAQTEVGGLDAVSVVEALDRGKRTVRLRFHGVAGGVEIAGPFDRVYELVLAADRELARLYRPDDRGGA